MAVTGFDEVLRNLHKEVAKVEGKSMEGLWEAGLQIQKVSQSRTPVEFGFLKGSAYTRREKNRIFVGYTQAYAVYVHENLEANHENGQSKFLESAVRDNQAGIIDIIKRTARVK